MKNKGLKKNFDSMLDEIDRFLRLVCGRPSPIKRLVIVSIVCVAMGVSSLYALINSVYNTGKRDAEFMKVQHIEPLELHKRDSINILNQE